MIDPGNLRAARTSLLIGFGVFLLTGLIWRLGYFQEPELWIYDCLVWLHSNPKAVDSRIVLVELTEKDIEKMDYPLRDQVLANVLEKIESGGPNSIGIDLYRDLPEPRDGSESPALDKTLLRYGNIIAIFLFDPQNPLDIPPPKVFVSGPGADPTRYGFNNFPDDKTVRRAFLYEPNDCTYSSLSCILAQYYLASQNIQASMDGTSMRLGKTSFVRLRGNDGGFVDGRDGGYQFLLDFRGPSKFDTRSISDVLALNDASIFKNKIVLIGIGADSSNDTFTTPISDREPGVAVHAQIVDQILRAAIDGDRPTVGLSQPVGWLWMAVWSVAGVIAGFFVRSHVAFALAVALSLGLIAVSAWLFFIHGYWIISFGPATVFWATAMLVKGFAAAHEQRQRATLMKLFTQRVSSVIAEEIWTQRETFLKGARPAAQRRIVTALFTDLKNYSTITEKMTPNELIGWVNECQSALAQYVEKNGGVINTYMGDGMMAVFGVPRMRTTEIEFQRDAINAVQCALSMASEIKQKNARWKAEGRPLAGLRVGIYTGEAMSGYLGSDDHLEYSVIGDTVNTASRLESFDKDEALTAIGDCRILIGARTYNYVKDRFPASPVGRLSLKGKAESTEVYKVLDSADPQEQTHI